MFKEDVCYTGNGGCLEGTARGSNGREMGLWHLRDFQLGIWVCRDWGDEINLTWYQARHGCCVPNSQLLCCNDLHSMSNFLPSLCLLFHSIFVAHLAFSAIVNYKHFAFLYLTINFPVSNSNLDILPSHQVVGPVFLQEVTPTVQLQPYNLLQSL